MGSNMLLYGVLCSLVPVDILATVRPTFPPITNNVCTLPANERVDIAGSCNFNTDTCGYWFPDILWERHTETVGSVIFGTVDDDNDGLSQTFAVFQSNNAKINNSETRAIVSLPINGPTNLCLRFWMLMPNQNSAVDVNVTSVVDNISRVVFRFQRNLTSQWRLFEIPLHENGTFKVSFISTKENNYGYVGIDSVRIQRHISLSFTTGDFTSYSGTNARNSRVTTSCVLICCEPIGYCEADDNSSDPTRTLCAIGWRRYDKGQMTTLGFLAFVPGYEVKSPNKTVLPTLTEEKLHTTTPGPTTTTTTTTAAPTTSTLQTTTKEITTHTPTTEEPSTTTTATDAPTTATTRPPTTTHEQTTTTTPPPPTTTVSSTSTTTTTMTPTTTTPTTTTAAEPTTESTIDTTTASTSTTTSCSCVCPASKCSSKKPAITRSPSSPSVCSIPEWERTLLPAYSCTFDLDLCDYTLSSYPHLWEVTRYHYGNQTVGFIDGDHSTGDHSGGYMVFNTFNYHVQSTKDHKFSSPALQGNVTYCVTFWYNMPTNQSALTLYTVTTNQMVEHLIWRVENTPTSGWVEVSIQVVNNEPFMLQFSSTKTSTDGFVAVDDIKVSVAKNTSSRSRRSDLPTDDIQMYLTGDDVSGCSCTCPPDPCDVTTTVAPYGPGACGNLIEAFHVTDLSCNFDRGTSCGYQLPIYPHLWELRRFRYGNVTLGAVMGDKSPDGDGVYVAFSTDNHHVVSGQGSQFVSQPLSYHGDLCIRFWYNMPTARSTLELHVLQPGTDTLVWKEANMTTVAWKERYVRVTVNGTFRIAFSSVKTGLDSYLAVDDIHVYKNLH